MKMGKIAVTPNNDKAASHSKDENLGDAANLLI